MGKHSARDGQDGRDNRVPQTGGTFAPPGSALGTPGSGRRRRGSGGPYTEPFDPFGDSGAFAAVRPQDHSARPPTHPEHREHGAWGTPGAWGGGGTGSRGLPFDPVEDWAEGWAAHDTATAAAAGDLRVPRHPVDTPGRTVPRPRQEFLDAFEPLPAPARPAPPAETPPPAAPPEPESAPGGAADPARPPGRSAASPRPRSSPRSLSPPTASSPAPAGTPPPPTPPPVRRPAPPARARRAQARPRRPARPRPSPPSATTS